MKISTKQLVLKDLEDQDAQQLSAIADDLDVSRFLSVVAHPYTIDDAKNFISYCLEQQKVEPRINYELGIFKDDILIGMIGLTGVNEKQTKIGYWLGKKYWKNGYMKLAIAAMLDLAKELNCKTLIANVFDENLASANLLQKFNFTLRGAGKPDTAKSTGITHNTIIYALEVN